MTARLRSRLRWKFVVQFALCVLAALTVRTWMVAQEPIRLGIPQTKTTKISADYTQRMKEDNTIISVMRGHCRVEHGDTIMTAQEMVVWESQVDGRRLVEIYLKNDARVESPQSTQQYPHTYLQVWSETGVTYNARWPREYQQPLNDPLLQEATQRRRASASQFNQDNGLVELPSDGNGFQNLMILPPQGVLRRVRISARSAQPFSAQTERSTNSTPAEQIAILSGGIKLNVDSPQPDGRPDPNAIELAADSMVVWTEPTDVENLTQIGERYQNHTAPLQVYLEGNIVIRQGDKTLRAQQAYYDVRETRALLIDADVKMRMPGIETPIRIRANRIRQLNPGTYHAQGAWLSGSYFGKPGYRLESSDIFFEPRIVNPIVHANGGWTDPVTGEHDDGVINWITTLESTFYIEDTPVGYLPYISSPAENPHLPITKVAAKSDNIFGPSLQTVWNPFHLFGRDTPEGLQMGLMLDIYGRRGPGIGLEGTYQGSDMFGMNDRHRAEYLGYYVHDDGRDTMGLDRQDLEPHDPNRGRIFLRHRHEFLDQDLFVNAELGYVSDRNFLESYYENEFDRDKDNETLLYAQQNFDSNWSWGVLGRPQVNEFENNTQWLPKGDLYGLSQPLLDGWLTWTNHTSAGYGSLNPADAPGDPRDVFNPLPYVSPSQGAVAMSRHELAAPLNLGPLVFSPYLRGEAAYWSEDLTGNELDRIVGTGGVRGSLTMWRAFPYVRNRIFNLNGLAHKMIFDFDYSYTRASEAITSIAQYNEFDDDAQERFRQRFLTNTYGGTLPGYLDPRAYAIRSGAGDLVSVPYHELVDDMNVLRLGWRHRLQTKVGAPGRERIRDWMTLDLEASFFPRPDQNNYGEDFGLLSARYSWLLGDRTTFLAGALYDTFDGGQQLWHAGILTQRPERGSIYVGVRQVKAGQTLDSTILTASASYLLSPKWIATASTAYDIEENMNRGQSLTLTRAGADWLFHIGGSFDPSKDSYGAAISFEPRFGSRDMSSQQFSSLLGINR